MLYKIKLFSRTIILNGFQNKLRTVLSITGIFIGILLFSYTNILVDSFYNAKMYEIEDMPDQSMIIYKRGGFQQKDYESLNALIENSPSLGSCDLSHYLIHSKKLEANITLDTKADIVGVNGSSQSIVTVDDRILHIVPNKIMDGRHISSLDNLLENKVIVIDKVAAQILFPNENPIGKVINFSHYTTKVESTDTEVDAIDNADYQIVGVIGSNYYSEQSKSKIINKINSQKQERLEFKTTVYIPQTIVEKEFARESVGFALWEFDTKRDFIDNRATIKASADSSFSDDGGAIFNDIIVEEYNIIQQIQDYRSLVLVVTLFVCLFSGLNNMNIYFFSIKERIGEIAIRKSLGASRTDIIFQFVCEGIGVGFIASVIAIIASVILGFITIQVVWYFFEINLIFVFNAKSMLLPLLVGLLQSVIFTLLPSFYGSKILVTEALRFE
ncbi:MAG: ABC transporter permease [Eubacteriales bacterium]|nr:ABC transporter permease [Clostridia bacterium]